MAYELFDDPPEVPLVDRDEVVETLAADGPDQPFAESVGCRGSRRSLQDVDAEAVQFGIEARRKDPVAVVNQKAVRVVGNEKLAELPDGPVGGRMSGDVGVQNAAGVDLHREEYIQNPERCGDRDKEIAGRVIDHDAFSVVAHKLWTSGGCRLCRVAEGSRDILRRFGARREGRA